MGRTIPLLLDAIQRALPAPHHVVLQAGQLVRIIVRVIQRSLNKPWIDPTSGKLYGLADHALSLITRHVGHEKLAPADRFRQAIETRALTDEIRSHGHDDVYRQVRRSRCRKNQPNECRGLISTLSERRRIEARLRSEIRETKQFLEVIDKQQHSAAARFPQRRKQRQCFGDSGA
jgi:hypothetical protein